MSTEKFQVVQDVKFVYAPNPAEAEAIDQIFLVGASGCFKGHLMRMKKVGDSYETEQTLSEGEYHYQFIVNHLRKHDPTKPCIRDQNGNWMNVVKVAIDSSRPHYQLPGFDLSTPAKQKYIMVAKWNSKNSFIVPLDSQGELPEAVLENLFEGACGLKYRDDLSWVILTGQNGKILPPEIPGKWDEKFVYTIAYPEDLNRDKLVLNRSTIFWESWNEEIKFFAKPRPLEDKERKHVERAIVIAQHYINTTRAKGAFVKLGADLDLLAKQTRELGFHVLTGRGQGADEFAWIFKEKANTIFINEKFMIRLANLSDALKDQEERKTIVFAMATAIINAFGRLVMLQTSASASATLIKASDQNARVQTRTSLKEDVHYIERCLFNHKIGVALMNVDKDDKEWTQSSLIDGIILDSCEHDHHISQEAGSKTSECLQTSNVDGKVLENSDCDQCTRTGRYKFMSKLYIETVHDEFYEIPEDILLDMTKIRPTKVSRRTIQT